IAVLAPPRRRDVVRHSTLYLPRESKSSSPNIGESVGGLDAHVDVQPVPTGRLRPADSTELIEHLARDMRNATNCVERAVGHRVEIDAPLVGLLGVRPSRVP